MIVSHRHKFIFYSNPKTGSESVRALLAPFQEVEVVPYLRQGAQRTFYPHIRPIDARDLFLQRGWDFEAYFGLVFVRNPWARMVSLYEMIRSGDGWLGRLKRRAGRLNERLRSGRSFPGFRLWLQLADAGGEPGRDMPPWRLFGMMPATRFAAGRGGEELVGRIMRLEDAAGELIPLLREVGLPLRPGARLPRKNVRAHRGYRAYYDKAARDRVADLFGSDIERFGYEF